MIVSGAESCACQKVVAGAERNYESFKAIRKDCCAIQRLLPGEEFKKLGSIKDLQPLPVSFTYLAYQRGYLPTLTRLVHQLLVKRNGKIGKAVAETWLLKDSAEDKKKTYKKNYGKLVELICAAHLEAFGVEVREMEIWGNNSSDIKYCLASEVHYAEVKYIGQTDEDFCALMASIGSDGSSVSCESPSALLNYAMLRVAEAAAQLNKRKCAYKKEVIIVYDQMSWSKIRIPIEELWMIPRGYRLVEDNSCGWNALLTKSQLSSKCLGESAMPGEAYLECLNTKIRTEVAQLDQISIYSLTHEFQLVPRVKWKPVVDLCQ